MYQNNSWHEINQDQYNNNIIDFAQDRPMYMDNYVDNYVDDNLFENMANGFVGLPMNLDEITADVKPDVTQTDSKLNAYYLNNPDNEYLHNIMCPKIRTRYKSLYHCYKKIIEDNMLDIIHSVIDGSTSSDELIIFNYAINAKRYDLIDLLIDSGFDLNKKINNSTVLLMHIEFNTKYGSQQDCGFNADMCKYLVCKGADIMINDKDKIASTMKSLAGTDRKDLLNYLLDCITDPDILYQTMIGFRPVLISKDGIHSQSDADISILFKIIDTGILYNLDDTKIDILVKTLGGHKPSTIEYMLNNGLQLKNNKIFAPAIRCKNTELITFLVNYGLVIDDRIALHVFMSLPYGKWNIISKYDIDYSKINEKLGKIDISVVNDFCDKGLDKDSVIKLLIYSSNRFNF